MNGGESGDLWLRQWQGREGGWMQSCCGDSNGVVQDGGQRIGIGDGCAEADMLRNGRPGYSQKYIMGTLQSR